MLTRQPLNVHINQLIMSLEKGSFRVEALDQYGPLRNDEAVRLFLDGEPLPPPSERRLVWYNLCTEQAKKGTPLKRVRVLPRIIPPYCKFELETFQNNVAHGEDIGIIIKEDNQDLADAWDQEYNLMDERRLIYIVYTQDGSFIKLEEETDPAEINRRVAQKQKLLERAIPYKKFIAQLRTSGVLEAPRLDLNNLNVNL